MLATYWVLCCYLVLDVMLYFQNIVSVRQYAAECNIRML